MTGIKIKKYLLLILIVNMFLSVANLASAATAGYESSGVQNSIAKFLCVPTKEGSQTWNTNSEYFGTTPNTAVGAANPSQNDLYQCINKLYRFAIAIASVTGIMFIVMAGYIYMSADGSQEAVDKAKSILTSTVTALVILFAGYIILRTINPDLIQFRSIQPPSVKLGTMTAPGADYINGVPRDQVGVPAGTNGTCQEPTRNLCQAVTLLGCGPGVCSSYSSAIASAASKVSISGVNMQALLTAVMYKESHCDPKAASSANSCGIMQFQVGTAAKFAGVCGAGNTTITCDWLKNHPNESICMAAYYFKELSQGACGTNIENLAAGYNGGATACQNSVTCSGEQGCTGDKRKWECMYNGSAGSKTTCNTGYKETREYAQTVLGCYGTIK